MQIVGICVPLRTQYTHYAVKEPLWWCFFPSQPYQNIANGEMAPRFAFFWFYKCLSFQLNHQIRIKRSSLLGFLTQKHWFGTFHFWVCLTNFVLKSMVSWVGFGRLKLVCFIANLCFFFYFLTFEKGKLLYIHPVGRSVGWSVGRLTSPLIFFQYIEA